MEPTGVDTRGPSRADFGKRIGGPGPLPVPPVVGQALFPGPDGAPDPAGATDCGEACLASWLQAARDLDASPGCIRQWMRKPMDSGLTTAGDLAQFVRSVGGRPLVLAAMATVDSGRLRRHGHYSIVLGNFRGPSELHWVLAYARDGGTVWCMDPFVSGEHRPFQLLDFRAMSAGVSVRVGG